MKFLLGTITFTPNALDKADENEVDLLSLLKRHANGDWGDLSDDDKKENEFSVKQGYRIFSAYVIKGVKFWIITEADRSATTILMPEDY